MYIPNFVIPSTIRRILVTVNVNEFDLTVQPIEGNYLYYFFYGVCFYNGNSNAVITSDNQGVFLSIKSYNISPNYGESFSYIQNNIVQTRQSGIVIICNGIQYQIMQAGFSLSLNSFNVITVPPDTSAQLNLSVLYGIINIKKFK